MALLAALPTVRPAPFAVSPALFALSSTVCRAESSWAPAPFDERDLALGARRLRAGRDLLDVERDFEPGLAVLDLDLFAELRDLAADLVDRFGAARFLV
ncbi:MAG TPA: hypothetical protein VF081_13205 [Solirubrobacterales bacterium]